MLKIADPTIVPAPRFACSIPFTKASSEVNNSGALLPIAISVAPAMSEVMRKRWEMISRLSTK